MTIDTLKGGLTSSRFRAAGRRVVLAWLAALLSVGASPLVWQPQQARADSGNFTFDYSRILPQDITEEKKVKFSAFLDEVYTATRNKITPLKSFSPKIDKVLMLYPWQIKSAEFCDSPSLGCYQRSKVLSVSTDNFSETARAKSTIAHEMMHAWTAWRDFRGSTGITVDQWNAYEEMFVEYYSRTVYPDTGSYDDLVAIMTDLREVVSLAAGSTAKADIILQKAIFTGNLDSINALVDPYLSTKNFAKQVGRFLSVEKDSNQQGAQAYIASVKARISHIKNGTCPVTTGTPDTGTTDGTPNEEPPATCAGTQIKISDFKVNELPNMGNMASPPIIEITWKTETPVKGSVVKYDTRATDLRQQAVLEEPELTTDHRIVLTTLQFGTTYTFKAAHYLDETMSTLIGNSETVSFKTSGDAPAGSTEENPEKIFSADGVVTITNETDTTAKISWGSIDPRKLSDFKVKYDTKDTNLANAKYPSGTQPSNQFTYTLTGLTPGTPYFVKVTYIGDGDDDAVGTYVKRFATTGINPVTGKAATKVGPSGKDIDGNSADSKDFPGCVVNPTKRGVLIRNVIEDADPALGKTVFGCYVTMVLAENMSYILIIATMLIILSGIQYMLSGGSSGELTKAKQRIAGILGGVILYFLIRFLAPVIASGLSL